MGESTKITVTSGDLSDRDEKALAGLDLQIKLVVEHGRAAAGLAAGLVIAAALRMEDAASAPRIIYGVSLGLGATAVLCGLLTTTPVSSRREPHGLVALTERRLILRGRLGLGSTLSLCLSILAIVVGAVVEVAC